MDATRVIVQQGTRFRFSFHRIGIPDDHRTFPRKGPRMKIRLLLLMWLVPFAARTPCLAQEKAAETAERWIAQFRTGWKATNEHMRDFEDAGWKVRIRALRGLVRLGGDAVPPLVVALDDANPDVRVFAAQAIGYIADSKAIHRLEQTLDRDKAPAARLYAADALGAIGGLGTSPFLKKAESDDANRDVKSHAKFALERQGKPLDDSVREALRSFDPDRIDSARVGETAPDFRLTDALGKSYQLSEFRDKRAVVLVFIYGDT
jgi:HEAT repeats